MAVRFTALETRSTVLSFALSLVDHFTAKAGLKGPTSVTLVPSGQKALRNPSGYYVFTGLSGSNFMVRIRNPYYLNQDFSVDTGLLDPNLPLATTVLHPRYLYPFPPGSTLIMGRVTDDLQQPLAGVGLAVAENAAANRSDQHGRFVLYFTGLTEDDVQVQNGRRLVEVNGNTTLKLVVQLTGYQSQNIAIGPIEEASTMLVTEPIVLIPA